MTWIEFLIIYLACGSPFGVYQITQAEKPISASNILALLAVFLTWPILAVRFLVERFVSGEEPDTSASLIERARAAIEDAAFPAGTTDSLFEFRDVFYRYTGLARAVSADVAAPRDLFDVSGHSNADIAAKCLARRNREKLAFHHTQARNEFVDLIAGFALADHCQELLCIAADLANELGDTDAVADLNALRSTVKPGRHETTTSTSAAIVR